MPVPEHIQRILIDQNVPLALSGWLKEKLTGWEIWHVNELQLQGSSDEFLYKWAQMHKAIIMTYDEDFADSRFYILGDHYGVIRLRVWPTSIEETQKAIERLIQGLSPDNWNHHLIIIDNKKIRVRKVKLT